MRLIKTDRTSLRDLDSVKQRKAYYKGEQDADLLAQAEVYYNNLDYFRKKRERGMRFVYGDQWGDLIKVAGRIMSQREYVTKQGNFAMQTNQIKNMVDTLSGVWLKSGSGVEIKARNKTYQKFGEILTEAMKTNWDLNDELVLFLAQMEELNIGGLCVMRETYEKRGSVVDAWSDYVNPNFFFFDSAMRDPRFQDATMVGELHDIDFSELCAKFAESPSDIEKFKQYYPGPADFRTRGDEIYAEERNDESRLDFYSPQDRRLCRVFEIWTKERRPRYHVFDTNKGELYDINADDSQAIASINAENAARLSLGASAGWTEEETPLIEYKEHFFMDTYWYVRFLTPDGHILYEGESPFPDRQHPYTVLAIPFTNGKIVPYIADAIDQNIAINRILTLDDWIRRTGAKGVTFVPESIIPDGMDYSTFAEQWTSIDGIVYYKPKANADAPHTYYGNVGSINTAEVVKMMSDLMHQSVPTSGAIQGQTPLSGTSAALYAQQTENSYTPIAALMQRFKRFVKDVTVKKLMYMLDNYPVTRFQELADDADIELDPATDLGDISQVQYKLTTRPAVDTAVYREQANDTIMQLAQMFPGQLTLEDALVAGKFTFGDKLLERLQQREAEMAAAQQAGQEQPQIAPDFQQKENKILNE